MSATLEPLVNEPALVVENTIRVLVVADIHLGIEWDLGNNGIEVPSQSHQGLARIIKYITSVAPDRVVLLGDVKHNVPRISWQEREEVPNFLEGIAGKVPVDIVPGNHDGDMEYLLRRISPGLEVALQPSRGFVLDGIGYFHGHTWPDPELLACHYIVMAHNHPTVRFTDPLGSSSAEPTWIRTRLHRSPLEAHYCVTGKKMMWSDPEVIIMPAFCRLCGGVAFNESLHDDLLGPVFGADAVDLDGAQAYLLDGTRLGKLKNIRKLDITQKRPPRSRARTTKRHGTVSRSP
ncbi:MAG: metallophosphoesterase [ANME-2 cluster archaeon]|nr:metallophosphoesterase [ANME-2 cluster archaeon]